MPNICKNCAFLEVRDEKTVDKAFFCHRYPPNQDRGIDFHTEFPMVFLEDWCGEFVARARPKNNKP